MFALSSDLRVGKLVSVQIVYLVFPLLYCQSALFALSGRWIPRGLELQLG
jgi:hypothetical protein